VTPRLKAPGNKRLKPKYDNLLLIFAFNFNLRHYSSDQSSDLSEDASEQTEQVVMIKGRGMTLRELVNNLRKASNDHAMSSQTAPNTTTRDGLEIETLAARLVEFEHLVGRCRLIPG
jgi:hypothetical protein